MTVATVQGGVGLIQVHRLMLMGDAVFTDQNSSCTKFLEVQFNTQNLKEADGNHFEWGTKKRKRPVFELV